MILKLSLTLPDDSHFVPIARHLSNTLLTDLKVIEEDAQAVELVIGELCNNVVLHGGGEKYQVLLEFYATRTVVTVEDNGPGFSFREIPRIGTVRKSLKGGERVGGFGLLLVESLSERVEFRRMDNKGMQIRAEIPLRYHLLADLLSGEQMDRADATANMACV